MSRRRRELAQNHPRAVVLISRCRSWLPPLNFITIHYAYFISVCLVSSLVFWGSSSPAWSISYTDSLFLVVSAMTEAGLNTVNLSQLTTWQQSLLFPHHIWQLHLGVYMDGHDEETRLRATLPGCDSIRAPATNFSWRKRSQSRQITEFSFISAIAIIAHSPAPTRSLQTEFHR